MVKRLYLMLLFFLPLQSEATTVKAFGFEGLCETAQTIVHVRCLEQQSTIIPGRDGIFTRVRFAVMDVVKGQAGDEVTLILPGGTYEGRRMVVPGMPQFVPGQETVLFLSEQDAYGSAWPVGLGQGCYGVTVEEGGHREVALKKHNPYPGALRKPTVQKNSVSLETFKGSIQDALHINPLIEPEKK